MKLRKTLRAGFERTTDYFHLILGFLSGIAMVFPFGWAISMVAIFIYLIYQIVEKEPREETYYDLVEFLCGYALSLPLVIR